jgi:type I restriction enzyme, S subunit
VSDPPLKDGWALVGPDELAANSPHSLGIGPFGSDLKVSDYSDVGVPLVFVRNIRANTFDSKPCHFVSAHKANELRAHSVQPGDVLITKMGEPPGDAAVYPASRPAGIITADCIRWRIDSVLGIPKYFAYATRSPAVQRQIIELTRGVAQQKISLARFRSVQYPVAPLCEQQRIVEAIESYFTRLDDAEATLERVQRNLKRYRTSVLKAAVEGRLVPTEAELARAEGRDYEPASVLLDRILAERRRRWQEGGGKGQYVEASAPMNANLPCLPEGWRWTNLAQLLQEPLINGRSVPDAPLGFPVLRLTALKGDRIDLDERKVGRWTAAEAKGYLVRKGDFFVARGNGSIRLVGRGGLVTTDTDPVAFPDTLIRVQVDAANFSPRLLAALWNSELIRLHIERRAKTAAGIHKVNQRDLSTIPLPLPPRAEQERLLLEIDRRSSIDDELGRIIAIQKRRCGRLRQAILKWAFEGKLAGQDSGDETASALLDRIRSQRPANCPSPDRTQAGPPRRRGAARSVRARNRP